MNDKRSIREHEKALIRHMIQLAALKAEDFPIGELVTEYEGGKMGSISFADDSSGYSGDIISVEYKDSDEIPVVITLTKDTDNQLLDLDFWKENFTKLLEYPTPDKVEKKEQLL